MMNSRFVGGNLESSLILYKIERATSFVICLYISLTYIVIYKELEYYVIKYFNFFLLLLWIDLSRIRYCMLNLLIKIYSQRLKQMIAKMLLVI